MVPIVGGCILPEAIQRLGFGGNDITEYLQKVLVESGKPHVTYDIAEDIKKVPCLLFPYKQKFSFVSQNVELDIKKSFISKEHDVLYKLPDGKELSISSERFRYVFISNRINKRCTEAIFRPELTAMETTGLEMGISACLLKVDPQVRSQLASNIVLVGGSSLFPGLCERITSKLETSSQSLSNCEVIAPEGAFQKRLN